MINPDKIEELAHALYQSLPPGLTSIGQDLQQQFKSILQMALNKMDLVTREEFEVQTKVLVRTRSKITELQEKLELLAEKINSK